MRGLKAARGEEPLGLGHQRLDAARQPVGGDRVLEQPPAALDRVVRVGRAQRQPLACR